MEEITPKHHKRGTPLPPTKANVLRLYSMRFCPYAHRTRLILAHKNIPHETVNVNLQEKPEWFLERNPRGLVPTLELNDQIVYESSIISDYLEEKYKDKPIFPTDTFVKARNKVLMSHFDSWAVNVFKLFRQSGTLSDEEKIKIKENMDKDLKLLEEDLGDKSYFGGEEAGILDYHVWPFLERYQFTIEKYPGPQYEVLRQLLNVEIFPKINKWVARMKEHPVAEETTMGKEATLKYMDTMLAGKTDPDVGLE